MIEKCSYCGSRRYNNASKLFYYDWVKARKRNPNKIVKLLECAECHKHKYWYIQ